MKAKWNSLRVNKTVFKNRNETVLISQKKYFKMRSKII